MTTVAKGAVSTRRPGFKRDVASRSSSRLPTRTKTEDAGTEAKATSNMTGYALFPASTGLGMHAYTFDATTGTVVAHKTVVGPFASYYNGYDGESTRIFPFDTERARFYTVDVWASDAPVKPAASS